MFILTDVPVCKHSNPKIYGVAETETIHVICDIDAEPQDAIFRWSFVNDFETVILQNWTSNETNNAISYSPKAENGYGMLSCWGRNSVGLQLDPCLIKIVPAGKSLLLLILQNAIKHKNSDENYIFDRKLFTAEIERITYD